MEREMTKFRAITNRDPETGVRKRKLPMKGSHAMRIIKIAHPDRYLERELHVTKGWRGPWKEVPEY